MIFAALCWSLSLLGPLFFMSNVSVHWIHFKSSLVFSLICTSDNVALGFFEYIVV